MKETVLTDISYEINIEKLMEELHVIDEPDKKGFLELIDKARNIAVPKAVYGEAYIEEKYKEEIIIDDIKFNSRILRVNLEEIHRVFPFIITAGLEVYEWAKSIEEILTRFWADKIQEYILQQAINGVFAHISKRYDLKKTAIMNPGSLEDWPISEQKKLFRLFDNPEKKTGVKLTDSFLMLPSKSISGILFPTEKDYVNCRLCSRENCSGRRALYDRELYQRQYSIKE
ncbi:MAG: vitamin B12 dependent-methionine synthase activation domain-containing protein [Halanaerobiaceae bacterium]